MFRRIRIKYAFKFGKLEHFFGRLLGLTLFLNCVYLVLFFDNKFLQIFSIINFLIWLGYILSHTTEKKLFGKYRWSKK